MNYGWSLDTNTWRSVRGAFSERIWSRTYLEDLYGEKIPALPGVYIIATSLKLTINKEPISGFRNAIYVGQSKNLRTRFYQHVKGYGDVTRAKEVFLRLEFWWTEIGSSDLDSHEQILINALGPSANRSNVIRRGPVTATVGKPRTI